MQRFVAEIAVVGSANLDLVVEVPRIALVGETVLGGDLARIAGGKGANQAVAAARLGRSVAMIGRVGDDSGGELLRRALHHDHVDTTYLSTTPDVPNGVALIAVAADGDNAIVVSPGANGRVSAADVEAAQTVLSCAAVTLVQLEVPIEAVAAAVEYARGIVVLNPAPAPVLPLPEDLLAKVDVLVPNQSELASLTGYEGPVDVRIAAQLAAQLPVGVVVVTLGALGALVVDEGLVTHVEAPRVTPLDTTAAGDSFCAALADALVRQEKIVDAVRWAVRVGAATTLRSGAQPSLPRPAEVESLLKTGVSGAPQSVAPKSNLSVSNGG
ncbi:MAG: ribokinase [Acidimicrobiia bacterium]|nr:ribokinase [Acidimicrobiia bacterium]